MKKLIFALLLCTVMAFLFSGCDGVNPKDDGKIDVVCTSFAPYDWAKNVIGDAKNVNLELLNKKGTDLHSFEPSADDIIKIDGCDVLILIGGEADRWALDAVSDTKNVQVVSLVDIAKEHGDICGTAEHEHTEECSHTHEHTHGESADEHIWMSLKRAVFFTEEIAHALSMADGENARLYEENADEYIKRLSELDCRYTDAVSGANKSVMVVADRFPFVYLADDYGIECVAAFPGCSADTDASPETVITLAGAIDEHDISFVAVTENTTGKTATAVINNTKEKNQQLVVIDSMQAVSEKDIQSGVTYIGLMEQNLEAVIKLLG